MLFERDNSLFYLIAKNNPMKYRRLRYFMSGRRNLFYQEPLSRGKKRNISRQGSEFINLHFKNKP